MPRTYIPKTNRRDINENDIKHAVIDVLKKTRSERNAAEFHGIKRSTLKSRIKKILKSKTAEEFLAKLDDSGNESSDELQFTSKYTVKQVFTNAEEDELVKYIKKSSDIHYGLTYRQIRVLAYDYVQILPNRKVPEQWSVNKIAGLDWLKSFMRRHPQLSLRKPESTSMARSTGFNKHRVEEFFNNYETVMKKYNFSPNNIYNIDETGVTTVMKGVKIVASTGTKQVGQISSAERGELVTFVGIVNAVGGTIPPVYIYPRIRNPSDYLIDAPIGSIALGNKSGWMTTQLFHEVLKHIVSHTNCSQDNKILILLDNHESHASVEIIDYCRNNGIVLLSFPPHTSHRLQPLDVGIYGPFKGKCGVAFNDFMLSNPGKTISIKNIAQLTNIAFLASFTPSNIISSFKKPGIWPFNRLVFTEADFQSCYVTDRSPIPEQEHADLETGRPHIPDTEILAIPSTSTSTNSSSADTNNSGPSAAPQKILSPEHVRPYPKAPIKNNNTTTRRQGKSRIYTSTPEKDRLLRLEYEKKIKNERIEAAKKRKIMKALVTPPKKALPKKLNRREQSSSSESDVSVAYNDGSSDDCEPDEIPVLSPNAQITLGDFVVVKFATKSTVVHYLGEVTNVLDDDNYEVNFLRRRGNSSTFSFPQIVDMSSVEKADIIGKLPKPSNYAKTARTSSLFKFNYNFDGIYFK